MKKPVVQLPLTREKYQQKINALLQAGDILALEAFLESQECLAIPYDEKNRAFVTSHKLQEFTQDPGSFYLSHFGPIQPQALPKPLYFRIGAALDHLLTYGNKDYQNNPEMKLSPTAAKLVEKMEQEFRANPVFKQNVKKKVFIVPEGKFTLKAELDDFDPATGDIFDIKTSADIRKFKAIDYLFQLAFYRYCVFKRTGKRGRVILEVVDKTSEQPRSAAFEFSESSLNKAEAELGQTLEYLRGCFELDTWPSSNSYNNLFSSRFYGMNGYGRPKNTILV